MRRFVLCVCGLLALVSAARAQAKWNFDSTLPTNADPTSLPANITGGTITAINATLAINTTSGSTGAYTGASGGNSASAGAVAGALNLASSSYFSFSLATSGGNRLFASGLSIGSRSTGTGPTTLTLYSSADNFTSPLATTSASANSSWALMTFPAFSVFGPTNGSLTFRIYGSGGSGSGAGNWRIDDLSLAVVAGAPGPAIATQPASQTVPPGATVSLSVVAAGAGTVTYQWRKGGVPISTITYPSATTATLNLGVVSTTDSGSYDVVVTDSVASVTSSAAQLTVAIAPATVTLGALAQTYDGNPHAVTVTTSPGNLAVAVTYNGQTNSPPTNAGSYAVVATITDPAYSGSASGTLVIAKAPATITFTPAAGFVPLVGVPFTLTATASSGFTPVRFSVTSGNATSTGTNGATITINDTQPVAITATQAGDANNSAASTAAIPPSTPATDLALTAITPSLIAPLVSGTYTQNFDSLSSGMPSGWRVFTGATATSLGTDVSGATSSLILSLASNSAVAWGSATGNFRNAASALNSGVGAGDSAATQAAYPNRALAVRQTSSTDPGAAFGFTFATTGLNVVSVSLSAQIISVQADATTWLLQAGVGSNPSTWTTLATINDTGVFGATPISVNNLALLAALNNQGRVWLRVAALTATTFGGTLDTFAIDNFTVVTGPTLTISTSPAAQTVTSGQSANFSVSAAGTGTLTYQWRRNGVAIPGATASTLSLASLRTVDSGNIDVVVSDTVSSATATATTLTVNPIATTISFSNLTAGYDGNPHAATATPTPAGATLGSVTYTGIGATPYSASSTAPTSPGSYLVTATATDSEHQGSASAILVISGASGATAPAVVTAPQAQSVSVGDVVNFSIVASGSPTPVMQWRKDGVAISGATNGTYTIYGAALTDAGNYDVAIANSGGSLTSPAAALTVAKKDQTITFVAPTKSSPAGAAVQLTATASSGLPVSYALVSGAASLSGGTLTGFGATVVVRASQAGNTTTYNAAATVDQTFTFVSGGTAPFLFTSPVDQTVNTGATVTFSAAAIGTPAPAWSWQKDGVAIDGATSATLTLTGVTLADAARYTVTATNSSGAASASAQLNVRAAPVIVTPPASQSVNAGATVTFAATIAGFPAPALQWRKNGIAIPGAVSNTLTLVNVSAPDAARYDLVATNSLGTATSTAATLTVAVHDFSGTYFGKFSGASGDFALYVRANGTGVFLGYLPGLKTALVATNVTIDLAGNFSLTITPTVAGAAISGPLSALGSASDSPPPTEAASQSITLNGTLNDATGTLAATAPELSATLAGTRAASAGSASAQAGYYSGAFAGSADARGYVIVAADGQAFVLETSSAGVDGAKGNLAANGRLTLTTANQSAVDLGFANGALSGTVRTAAGVTASLTGATDALAGSEHLANLSARGAVAPGAPLIAGFVITGATSKQVLLRAAGPALAAAPFNLPSTLDDPALTLFRGSTIAAQNDNWSASPTSAAAITAAAASVNAFAFRNGSADAALLVTLAPGNYTAQVSAGPASLNPSGLALVEIYEVLSPGEAPGAIRLANLSARSPVVPDAPLIAGFVINGTAPQRVLIRGIGPGLAGFGVAGALANPTLTLFRGSTAIKTDDDWFRDADAALIRNAAANTGAFALGATSLDASLLLYLDPGAYTAQVSASGTTNGTGIALVEIYESP
jgi:hypothetical protein